MSSRIGHTTRYHPLCPYCQYDLVATIADNSDVCPECGERFEPNEVLQSPGPDGWTVWTGLRHAVISLAVRAIGVAVVWSGVTWLLLWLGAQPFHVVLLVFIAVGLLGALSGVILGRKLTNRAGFSNPILSILACLFGAVAIIGATLLVELYVAPLGGYFRFLSCGVGIVVASALAIRYTILDE